jgi:hypothetical protein
MKRTAMSLAAVASLALGVWMIYGSATGPAESLGIVPPAKAPAAASPALPAPEVGCEALSPLPEGVEAGPEQACCLDECRTDFDCFFRCGGEPGKCTMPNPCCTVCQCVVSSYTTVS